MSPILRPSRSTLFESSTESLGRLIDGNGNEFRVPTYTIKEIRDAVPQECYNRSTIRGLGYVLRDASLWIITIYISWQYIPKIEFQPLRGILWCVSGFVTGLFATGLWVLAHECGHQAFSTSKVVNDTVGFTLHSILLVPYFAWKITHGKHHKSTGHMERDMVFVPKTREQFARRIGVLVDDISELTEDAPINTLVRLLGRQILGWPIYLFTNDTGHNFHERQTEGRGKGKRNGIFTGVNHFSPHSPLFEAKDSRLIVLSDIGIFGMGFILYLIGRQIGWTNLFLVYGMPWLWVHHWLVLITFLQHTDPSVPHYNPSSWTFPRGAAATIDRDFGFIGRHLFHGIIETHVLHHYISTIPFYHADKATNAIKAVMGDSYLSDTRDGTWGFLRAGWTTMRQCQWVEPSAEAEGAGTSILFFRNRNGLGERPMKIRSG